MPPDPSAWTPAAVTALIGGIVTLIGAVTAMIVTLHGLRKKADETGQKVDGHMSAMMKELEVRQARIDGLEKLNTAVTEAKQEAVQALTTVVAVKEKENPCR